MARQSRISPTGWVGRIGLLAGMSAVGLLASPGPAQPASFAYVANLNSNTVSVIDMATNAVVATVRVGGSFGLAVNPAGTRLYVANHGENTISVIDTATNAVVATVPGDDGPASLAVNPTGTRVYVANLRGRSLSVIDATSNAEIARVPLMGSGPQQVAVHPAGSLVYAVDSETLFVVDAATNAVVATVPTGGPHGVAVHPAGTSAYVANFFGRTLAVIDTATNRVTASVPVGQSPAVVALHPTGTRAYVSNYGSNTLSVIDTATNAVVATVPVGNTPEGVAVDPAGRRVYVANYDSNTVSVIDTATNAVVATVPVGNGPAAVAVGPDLVQRANARVTLSATQLRPGQMLAIGLQVQNPTGGSAAELYAGVVLPGGELAVFFSGPGVLGGPRRLATPASFQRLQEAPPGFTLSAPTFFQFTFPEAGIAAGAYQVFAALVRRGAFLDDRIDPGDVLSLEIKAFVFSP